MANVVKAKAPELSKQEAADREEVLALQRRQSAKRKLTAIAAGYTIGGVRLQRDDTPEGVVVTFNKAEGDLLAKHVKAILEARK